MDRLEERERIRSIFMRRRESPVLWNGVRDNSRPWLNVKYIERGQEGWDATPVHKFKALLAGYEIPELIWCKLYFSDWHKRDLYFVVAFAYQNSDFFLPVELRECIEYVSRTWEPFEHGRQFSVLYNELVMGDDEMLDRFFAFDIRSGIVLTLTGQQRAVDLERAANGWFPGFRDSKQLVDPCLPHYVPYLELYDRVVNDRLAELEWDDTLLTYAPPYSAGNSNGG